MVLLDKNDTVNLFVPGRLCIMGEHSDWAGRNRIMNSNIIPGEAIVTGIKQGIYATVMRDDKFSVVSEIDAFDGRAFMCEMNKNKLESVAKEGGFFSYVAGVASYMLENYIVGGVSITVNKMDLPIKMGLSSSAAICVLVARAFNQLYNLKLSVQEEMNIAYGGELRTPSKCGQMDQACAFGIMPVRMIFDGYEVQVEPISIKSPLYFVVADLKKKKDTIKILNNLQKSYPFAKNRRDNNVHDALGKDNRKYVTEAVEAMENGNIQKLGKVMNEYQYNFDEKVAPASIEQLRAPVLHSILHDKNIVEWTYGMKGVGSQGDGAVQFLAKNKECQDKLIYYLENVKKMPAFSLSLTPERVVKKAIVPVAGFAKRLFPVSKGLKKAFMPVPDKEGNLKPALMIILEEIYYAGITQICLVISEDEQREYEDFFRLPPVEYLEQMSEQNREYALFMDKIGHTIKYVYQKEKKGFGHAVYLCREFANDEPVLLMLGDTLYRSNIDENCARQLMNAYEKSGGTMVSLQSVDAEDVINYGIAYGNWENEDETVLNLAELVEKPTIEYAKKELAVRTRNGECKYYAIFGQYILTKEVFEALENDVINHNGDSKEIQLTDALNEVNRKCSIKGLLPKGKSYDIGIPQAYVETFRSFQQNAK